MNPRARDVVARLQRAGHTAYLAGGCVRDHLLGIEAKDCDVATSATAEEVQGLFAGRVTDLVGKSFGVVRVREGDEFFEVAMFRQDGTYIDGRHPATVTLGHAGGGRAAARLHHQRDVLSIRWPGA